jgi:hypothetical protein
MCRMDMTVGMMPKSSIEATNRKPARLASDRRMESALHVAGISRCDGLYVRARDATMDAKADCAKAQLSSSAQAARGPVELPALSARSAGYCVCTMTATLCSLD